MDATEPTPSCCRCGNERAPIEARIPFREPLKSEVQAVVCAACWKEWLDMQIKVINELALNLGDPRSHDIIESHARQFFGLAEPDAATDAQLDLSKVGDEPPNGDIPASD